MDTLIQAPIERDLERFNRIVRGTVRKGLKKYVVNDALIGKRGKDIVRIPIPQIDLPTFRYGRGGAGGVGSGPGKPGDIIGQEPGAGGAGDGRGDHIIEAEISIDELADILGEELELPRIKPKQRKQVMGETHRYTSARRTGPESLRYMKRTYIAALRRMVLSGEYDPDDPCIIPVRDDRRYRSWRTYPCPETNAVVFYSMDYSGSMSDQRKRLVRLTAFWIDAWIQRHYDNVITRYIIHDTEASEVSQQDFYQLSSGGGTYISSAYDLMLEIIKQDYNPDDWNLYGFHFSDGENWDNDDQKARASLQDGLLPVLNLFCYGQVTVSGWPWSSKEEGFYGIVANIQADNLIAAKIDNDGDVYDAIKKFLGKGY